MRKLILAAAALAALAMPAATPAEANHRDGWGVRADVQFARHDRRWDRRWDRRSDRRWRHHWRGDRRWRGHHWGWRPPVRRGWRHSCRSMWWDGWAWRCRW